MFDNHQPVISGWARACPENFAMVVCFAIISARVHFKNMPRNMREFRRLGLDAPCVRQSTKYEGVRLMSIPEERTKLFLDCERLYLARDIDALVVSRETSRVGPGSVFSWEDALLARLYCVYGLGFAKAGFVAQMVYGVSGCLDSHNLTRFGIYDRLYQSRQYRGESQAEALRRAQDYNATIARWGGTRALWDTWCDYVARQYPEDYINALQVSLVHLEALGLG